MGFNVSALISIKTRVTVFMLGIFVSSIWILSIYATSALQADMQRVLGEQQLSTVSLIASSINEELQGRLKSLELVAATAPETLVDEPAQAQKFLESLPVLRANFNGGISIVAKDGTAIADAPRSNGRIGVNYLGIDFVRSNLQNGLSMIGSPAIGPTLKVPAIGMGVPLKNAHGKVIGALTGIIRLDKPTFLDKISENKYGETGGYFLVSTDQRTIITATDKSRAMEILPSPGVNRVIDRFLNGEEGTAVVNNAHGIEVLSSVKKLPTTGWIVVASLPAEDAFAPIRRLHDRLISITTLLTVMAGLLTWWMLRRELAPIWDTVDSLDLLAQNEHLPLELPVNRKDELGVLIRSFNRILNKLGQREAELTESQQHLKAIIDAQPQCVKIIDASGALKTINSAGLRLLEASSPELIESMPLISFVAPEYQDAFMRLHQRVINGESRHLVFEIVGLDGGRRWVETHAIPLKQHSETFHLAITQDITERRKIEETLRIAAIAFESELSMVITDSQRTILQVNKAFTQITGYSAEDAVGRTPNILSSGRHDAAFYIEMNKRLLRDGAWQGELWNRKKNGEIYPVWLSITSVKDGDGNVTNYIGSHYDITEQKLASDKLKKLNHELGESRSELRAMVSQKEHRLEQEKKHIAREVHDELGQLLTALRMNLSMCAKEFGKQNPGLPAEVRKMKVLVDQAIVGVRNVASNLRPAALDMGLLPSIEWLGTEFSSRTSIPFTISVQSSNIDINETLAVVLFRIVQESLTNIVRHAQATQVEIELVSHPDALELRVRDNGRGFLMGSQKKGKTFGLLGMHERTHALGGQLSVNSTPGLGTVVRVWVPLDQQITKEPFNDSTVHSR